MTPAFILLLLLPLQETSDTSATEQYVPLANRTPPPQMEVVVKSLQAPTPPSPLVPRSYSSLWEYAGVNIGIAAVATTPRPFQPQKPASDYPDQVIQTDVSPTLMPYASIHPGFWFMEQETRTYCVAKTLFADTEEAQKEADRKAQKNGFEAWKGSPRTDEEWNSLSIEARRKFIRSSTNWTDSGKRTANDLAAENDAKEEWKHSRRSADAWDALDKKKRDELVYEATGWRVNTPARCWISAVGIFVGYPMPYKAAAMVVSSSPDGFSSDTFDIIPYGALGVSVGLPPYLNILVGIDLYAASTSPRSHGVGFLLGLGGNTDIFTKLVKL